MFTVLFTAVGRRVELIQAFQKSFLQHNIPFRIIAVDTNPEMAPAAYYVDKVYQVPNVKNNDYIDKIISISKKERVNIVIPLYEPEFFSLDERRTDFCNGGVNLILSHRKALEICNDKLLTYQFFKSIGICTPDTWLYPQLPPCELLPIFIKPQFGMGSVNSYKIDRLEQVKSLMGKEKSMLVQPFIEGTEYTIDVLADFTGKVVSAVPRKRIEVRAGEVVKSCTVDRPDIAEMAVNITENLNVIGPITLQCIDTGQQLYWIEINARFGGGVTLSFAAGVDYPLFIYKMTHGERLQPIINQHKKNLTMLRYDSALYL